MTSTIESTFLAAVKALREGVALLLPARVILVAAAGAPSCA